MARHQHRVPLTILSGQTTVEFKGPEAKKTLAQSTAVAVYAPDVVDGTISVEYAFKEDPVAADYAVANPATVLAVNQVNPLPLAQTAAALRIIQSVGAAADRVYLLVAQLDVTDAIDD